MSGAEPVTEELRAFETGRVDPAKFPHREHVRLGYEMLCRYSFGNAISRFSGGLRLLAAKAERPQLYHETITVAFLALINERRVRNGARNWNEFQRQNADLFDKRCLEKMVQPAAARDRSGTANVLFALKERRFEIAEREKTAISNRRSLKLTLLRARQDRRRA
jgi:hypothetical protein